MLHASGPAFSACPHIYLATIQYQAEVPRPPWLSTALVQARATSPHFRSVCCSSLVQISDHPFDSASFLLVQETHRILTSCNVESTPTRSTRFGVGTRFPESPPSGIRQDFAARELRRRKTLTKEMAAPNSRTITTRLYSEVLAPNVLITHFEGHITRQLAYSQLGAFLKALGKTVKPYWIMNLTDMTGFDSGAVAAGSEWFRHLKMRDGYHILL